VTWSKIVYCQTHWVQIESSSLLVQLWCEQFPFPVPLSLQKTVRPSGVRFSNMYRQLLKYSLDPYSKFQLDKSHKNTAVAKTVIFVCLL